MFLNVLCLFKILVLFCLKISLSYFKVKKKKKWIPTSIYIAAASLLGKKKNNKKHGYLKGEMSPNTLKYSQHEPVLILFLSMAS